MKNIFDAIRKKTGGKYQIIILLKINYVFGKDRKVIQ